MTPRLVPGTNPLAAMPMSEDEVRHLVERVRCLDQAPSRRGGQPGLARVGARYAALARCSLLEATRALLEMLPPEVSITAAALRYHWKKLYPGVPTYCTKKRRAAASAGGSS